jgi:hypothetical protein
MWSDNEKRLLRLQHQAPLCWREMSQLAFAIFRNDFTFHRDTNRTQYFLHGVIISYRIRQDGLPLSYPYDKYSYGGRKLIWLSYYGGNGYQRKNCLYYLPIDKRVHLTTCCGFGLTKQNLEELRKGYVVTQKPNDTWARGKLSTSGKTIRIYRNSQRLCMDTNKTTI